MKINTKYKGNEIEERYLQRVRDRNKNKPPSSKNPSNSRTALSKEFSLENRADSWITNGVEYRNGIYTVDLSKSLLPAGTINEHAQRAQEAMPKGEYHAPDFPLFHSLINTWHQNREGPFKSKIELARSSLADLIKDEWLAMLTIARYNPSGDAIFIHNHNQTDAYQNTATNFEGPDGDITTTANVQGFLNALLSTAKNPQEISEVYSWFRNLPSYLWRINSKPDNTEERVARFYAARNWSCFGCIRLVDNSNPALGVKKCALAREKI